MHERGATAALAETGPDDIERAAIDATDDWQPLVQGLTDPIEELVAGASSLEAIRDGLAGLADGMDVEAVREQLARATFAGKLAGDVDIGIETGAHHA